MATPALRALRQAQPRAAISLEIRPQLRELLDGTGLADRFLPSGNRSLRSEWARLRLLREARFDWVVLFPDSPSSAAVPFLARIPLRAGYARGLLRRALLTSALAPPWEAGVRVPISMIERYLLITRSLGCEDPAEVKLEVVTQPAAAEQIAKRLANHGLDARDGTFVVTPGASFGASKLWPPEHFARACDGISRERALRCVLAPGPGEEAIARAIAAQMREPAVVLVEPVTRLAELVALIGRSELLLTNDTGPRQLAVALATPAVVLMGPTDPRHTAHLLERQRVLLEDVACSPCHLKVCAIDHRCMTRLRPEFAVAAARDLLS